MKKFHCSQPSLGHNLSKNKTKQILTLTPTTMKKLFYLVMFIMTVSLTVTACAEEEIAPSTELENGGGVGNTGGY